VLPVELAHTDDGAVIVELGTALIVTVWFCEPPLLQPALLVTVQFKATEPLAPAVKVTVELVWPAVIVPPLIVQP
jgi:hypothetical protein